VAIDNDPQIVEGMRTLLSAWGCVPIVARSQREALSELAREKRVPDAFSPIFTSTRARRGRIIALRWKFDRTCRRR